MRLATAKLKIRRLCSFAPEGVKLLVARKSVLLLLAKPRTLGISEGPLTTTDSLSWCMPGLQGLHENKVR